MPPTQDAFRKRRTRLVDDIERLMAAFAQDCPGYFDDIVTSRDSSAWPHRPPRHEQAER
ncbi:MAG: hypothetical protein M3P40_06175 [Actinomycetota bacterium]|nr:hypothetical protein [Actinomycetota bacterium]